MSDTPTRTRMLRDEFCERVNRLAVFLTDAREALERADDPTFEFFARLLGPTNTQTADFDRQCLCRLYDEAEEEISS